MSRSKTDYLILAFKGIAMGAGEFIPGFSAASAAFISGIYKELITSLSNLRFSALKVLFKSGFKEFWSKINGTFLLILFAALLSGLVLVSFLTSYLFKTFPISTWSFLFGVILASIIYVFKDFVGWNAGTIIPLIIGIAINVGLTFVTPFEMSRDSGLYMILICAFLAAFAAYLPGVSVSLVLILLGQYEFIIKSISGFETTFILIYFGTSFLVLVIFSRIFSWLINKYESTSKAVLAGLMIGSLYELWPWKHTLLSHYSSQFEKILPIKQENVLPHIYFEKTAKDPQTLYAILLIITGFLVVYLLQNTFSKTKESEQTEF